MKCVCSVLVTASLVALASVAHAQPEPDPAPLPPPSAPPPTAPPPPVTPSSPSDAPPPDAQPPPEPRVPTEPSAPQPPTEAVPPPMSEGRMLVSAYNSGFHWGLSPGIVVVKGDVGFALGVSAGYGFDLGSVIIVPGLRLTCYFTDPTVLVGLPVARLVIPVDRFAPFIEGGAGVGNVGKQDTTPSQTGAALEAGGGFMVHISPALALGAEASYLTITGTPFEGWGVGPIIAIGF